MPTHSDFGESKNKLEHLENDTARLENEVARLRNVIMTGGALYRAERANMGVAGGDEDVERLVERACEERESPKKTLEARLQNQRAELKRKNREVSALHERLYELRTALFAIAQATGDGDLRSRMLKFLYPRTTPAPSSSEGEETTR